MSIQTGEFLPYSQLKDDMGTAVINLEGLLKGIPSGAWVAISELQNKVLSYGADAQAVLTEAENKGEAHPLIVRVPDQASSLFL